jgi:hypothetical protein
MDENGHGLIKAVQTIQKFAARDPRKLLETLIIGLCILLRVYQNIYIYIYIYIYRLLETLFN